jgi:hypothetical protein
MVKKEYQTNISKRKKMKTFKQHIKEAISPLGVGTNNHDGSHVGDGSVSLANIHDADVLKKVNAYVGSVADKEYLNPQAAVEQLRNNLNKIGLTVSQVDIEGNNGTVNAEVTQFGGRFGKDVDGADIDDDGVSHRKEGGLKLQVKYETLQNGSSKVYAKLV